MLQSQLEVFLNGDLKRKKRNISDNEYNTIIEVKRKIMGVSRGLFYDLELELLIKDISENTEHNRPTLPYAG